MSEYIIHIKDAKTIYGNADFLFPLDAYLREKIVRCRDCLKWDYDSPYPKKACFEFSNPEDGYIVMTSPDGFCAWAERRQP